MTSPLTDCPLCAGPNGCAMAAGGSVDSPCWCRSVVFGAEVLAQVPQAQRGQVCICARCASLVGTQSALPGRSEDTQGFPTGLSTPSVDN
ncbi:MAG: cysteine-rich CWC family protein [Aquabacterium sp.]|uniref:cysteine-rich CWC family protein n=1 Tax=Aquabacterium sp. TaxID=1872578 RepID=UPI002719448E|nr:cysteine-rich CWC family protein [Aquabacterium sp.]MDO9002922.1 cysteine-rich CWC family protein [Aquabacterium sp.]